MGRKMEWASREKHMGGIPRKMVFLAVGAFAKAVATLLNTTSVHKADTLLRLVRSRSTGIPLLTVSNHMSTLDDPLLWGFKGFPSVDAKLARWALAAEDICFKNSLFTYFFRLGKCIPIKRGGGIYQEHMNEALRCLNNGAWLHTFPEETTSRRWPAISSQGLALDEAAQRCLYSTISEQIQTAMEKLRGLGKSFLK
ncbi:N-acylphosphatidylethanolamine synthase-like isoform X2 [Hibiscus syriacus]|uniref:N-acylphosphatidylethanolamine synthase-like isoform X2 n=1 Tax=Hibiscus syriacus TaxID=106335 RepID=UPI001923D375|nr:N-acylphosphatidylethanolamine synthase-like isoform X2 [Hibiscus syriacus]